MKHFTTLKSKASIVIVLLSITAFGQDLDQVKYTTSNKGKIYVNWGGNRESFSKSDITFKGDDYNFTLYDVKSHDKPQGWHIDYINPGRVTIPQTNFKLGYFISNKYMVSIGVDHMKYVVLREQFVNATGEINLDSNDPGAIYNGIYNNTPVQTTVDFLRFEHTNGLNYVFAEFSRFDDISSLFKINNTDKFQVNISEGIGAGILYPKTNTTLLSMDRYDEFHVSGYGLSLNAGLNLLFFKHFFIQADLKGGYINMGDIRTTSNVNDSASQNFFFLQRIISLGGIFRI